MKIAFNYLTELITLIKEKKVEIDYIKYPSVSFSNIEELTKLTNIAENKILFHNTLSKNNDILTLADSSFIDELDIESLKEAIKLSGINGLSIHLSDKNAELENIDKTEDEILDTIYKNVEYVKDNFKNLDFFTIENREYGTIFEKPEFINKVFNKVDCKFLMDISHCKGAADQLGYDVIEYIKQLPLDKVYELHLNGWEYDENGRFISHIKMNEESYMVLDYLLQHSNPEIITVEYGVSYEDNKYVYNINTDDDNEIVKQDVIEQIEKIRNIIEKRRL